MDKDIIEIPANKLFEAMLKQMDLPAPSYQNHGGPEYFWSKVVFYPSAHHLQSSLPPHSILSCVPGETMEEAIDMAAKEGIKYMETAERKVLKDYNYNQLEREKTLKRRVQRRLEKREKALKETVNEKTEVSVSCDIYIDKVRLATQQIQKMVSESLAPACTTGQIKHNANLLAIQALATDLHTQSDQMVATLKATGSYPFNNDNSQSESTCDTSEEERRNELKCEALHYDSCGNHIDDDDDDDSW